METMFLKYKIQKVATCKNHTIAICDFSQKIDGKFLQKRLKPKTELHFLLKFEK
jgi:hypothetical protein